MTGLGWVAVELQSRCDIEPPQVIVRSIQHIMRQFGSVDVFVPATGSSAKDTRYLVTGYAFIRRNTIPDNAFFKLENTKYVQSVVVRGPREIAPVSDTEIRKLQAQTKDFTDQKIMLGDRVKVLVGPFKNIEGNVVDDLDGTVCVHIKLRSTEKFITLPRESLQALTRSEESEWLHAVIRVNEHLRGLRRIWQLPIPDMTKVVEQLELNDKIQTWVHQWREMSSFVFGYYGGIDNVMDQADRWANIADHLESWDRRLAYDRQVLVSLEGVVFSDFGSETMQELSSLDDFLGQLSGLESDVERAEDDVATAEGLVRLVLVDGMNLALRCYHAPGLSQLHRKGETGIKTGAALGILRSLRSLKDTYPAAKICVVWDGSSRVRRSVYPEYKSGRDRSGREALWPQIEWVRKVLPLFGVEQAYHPDAEADDVICTIAQGRDRRCVIVSTDRDLLQVVSPNCTVLVPGVGHRGDLLFTESEVVAKYEVPPALIPHLRAFIGDPSDAIPKVPRIPKGTIKKLLSTYGSVSAIYEKGLHTVSKAYYERLRQAEPQVRLNLQLIQAMNIPDYTVVPAEPDPDGFYAAVEEFGLPSLTKMVLLA